MFSFIAKAFLENKFVSFKHEQQTNEQNNVQNRYEQKKYIFT